MHRGPLLDEAFGDGLDLDDLPELARPRLERPFAAGGVLEVGAHLVGEGPGCGLGEVLELDRRHRFGGRLVASAQDRAGRANAGGAATSGPADAPSSSVDATAASEGRS